MVKVSKLQPPSEAKAMRLPVHDQAGRSLGTGQAGKPADNGRVRPHLVQIQVEARAAKGRAGAIPALAKTIRVPSGDQLGSWFKPRPSVSRSMAALDRSMTCRSLRPSLMLLVNDPMAIQ